MKEGGLNVRKCPSLCSGPSHGWTHCSLFLELLVTLGQLDRPVQLPWSPATSKCTWKTASLAGRFLIPFVALERSSAMAVRWWGGGRAWGLIVFSGLKSPALAIWNVGGHSETAPLLRTRSFLGRKVKRASRSGPRFMLPSCLLCHSLSSLGLVDQRARVYSSALLSLVWRNLSCTHHGVCTVRKGPRQLDYLGLDLSSNVT